MPIGRPPTVDIRNTHLSYVITWYVRSNIVPLLNEQLRNRYSLSAMTSVMFFRLLKRRKQAPGRKLPRFT